MPPLLTNTCELEMLGLDKLSIVKPFFDDFHIYKSILQAIFEGKIPGKFFTNDTNNPAWVLVCSSAEVSKLNAPVFLAGKLDLHSLAKIVSYLSSLPKVSLAVPLGWEFIPFFEDAGFKTVDRVQFRRPLEFFDLAPFQRSLPNHMSVKRISSDNFAQCDWYSSISSLYGNSDRFLSNGMGFCLVDQSKIAGETYGFIANGMAEIGVATNPAYRGQNLGTLISAHMLDYCYKNDIEPFWNCDITNPASAAIAKKLGFEEDCRYRFLRWTSY